MQKTMQNFVGKIKKKCFSKLCHIRNSVTGRQSVDPDEAAQYEPPHLDLHCLQI